MLKQIMNHVRGNKDINLNNRFDELLSDLGPRRCKSMIDFGNDLEDDPRLTRSEPNSPRHDNDDFLFDREGLPTIDNVYAESKPPDPIANLGKIFTDFDSQVQHKDFDKFLSRKGGDFGQFEKDDNQQWQRAKKNKPRGRKNQYYTQIDEEDDEEAENIGIDDDELKDHDDLDIIKEEDDEDEFKKQKKDKKRLQMLKEQELRDR